MHLVSVVIRCYLYLILIWRLQEWDFATKSIISLLCATTTSGRCFNDLLRMTAALGEQVLLGFSF